MHPAYTQKSILEYVFEVAVATKDGQVKCPKCKKAEMIMTANGIFCSDKVDCKFALWREVAHKKLTDANLIMLLERKKTGLIKGFKKKSGGEFSCSLTLTNEYKVEFEFSK